jgi:hypothetical protein
MADKLKELKALTIAQPWAECIVRKGKNVENRSWRTKFRGYFAIHSSASSSKERFDTCNEDYGISVDPKKVAYGSIIGFARLIDVISADEVSRDTKKWFQGDYGFVLDSVIKLKEPIRVKGALSFWKLSGADLKACLKQLSPAQRKKLEKNPARNS